MVNCIKSTLLNIDHVAGYDVTAYMSTFSALEKDQILGKLVLLYSTHDNIAVDSPGTYSLPRLVLNRLFLSERVPHVVKKLTPLATGPFSSITSNGGLISPQSPARSVGRPIDPSLVSLLPLFCFPFNNLLFCYSLCTNVRFLYTYFIMRLTSKA